MTKLFEDFIRDKNDPAEHNENEFDYMNKSSREIIVEGRKRLSDWFVEYPDEEKIELKNRFKKEFDSAFYELFLYTLFIKHNFEIIIHPNVPNSTKRPDFLISKGNLEIYVEAKTISSKSEREKAEKRKLNQLFDEISKDNFGNTILLLEELQLKTESQPSAKKIKQEIKEKLSNSKYKTLSKKFEQGIISDLPKILIDNEDVYLKIGIFYDNNKTNSDEIKRPIGSYPYETLISGEDILKKSINIKAKRYGTLDKPYIVCLNALDYETSNLYSIENAIWGTEKVYFSTDPSNRNIQRMRQPDGVFYNNRPRLKNLSGVLITKVNPYILNIIEHSLFKHPFTENHLNFDDLGFEYDYLKGNEIQKKKGIKLKDIFLRKI